MDKKKVLIIILDIIAIISVMFMAMSKTESDIVLSKENNYGFNIDISSKKEFVKPGDTVTFDIDVTDISMGGSGLNAITANLQYDETLFEYVEVTGAKEVNQWDVQLKNSGFGYKTCYFYAMHEGITDEQQIAALKLHVKENIDPQITEVKFFDIKSTNGEVVVRISDKVVEMNLSDGSNLRLDFQKYDLITTLIIITIFILAILNVIAFFEKKLIKIILILLLIILFIILFLTSGNKILYGNKVTACIEETILEKRPLDDYSGIWKLDSSTSLKDLEEEFRELGKNIKVYDKDGNEIKADKLTTGMKIEVVGEKTIYYIYDTEDITGNGKVPVEELNDIIKEVLTGEDIKTEIDDDDKDDDNKDDENKDDNNKDDDNKDDDNKDDDNKDDENKDDDNKDDGNRDDGNKDDDNKDDDNKDDGNKDDDNKDDDNKDDDNKDDDNKDDDNKDDDNKDDDKNDEQDKNKEYTITYDLNNGKVDGTNPEKYTVESEEIKLINPTRDGYTFLGWTGTGLDKATKEVTIAKGSTGNREYTATWEANKDTKYKVEYYLEDLKGDYKLEETANLEGETDTKAIAEIKVFEGFTENENHQDRKVEGTIKADESLVLKVYYTRNSYELTLVKGAYIESVAGAGTYKYGEVVEITATAENKEGYTYSNFAWETQEAGILENAQEKTTKVTMPAKAVEVTAKQERTAKEYTITYDLANGKVDGTNPEKYTVESEEIKLINPTREGYTFLGWIGTGLDKATKEVVIAKGSTGNREYTATWETNKDTKYTVEYYTETLDGKYELEETKELKGETDTKATAEIKAFEGFTENTEHKDRKVEGTIKADGSLVLKVYYTRNSYELTLVKGDYIESVAGAGTYKYGEVVEITAVAENKDGYTYSNFAWETAEQGILENAQEKTTKVTMPAKAVEVTAKQERTAKEYTITYDLANGKVDGTNPEKYTVESEEIKLINPTRDGYTFAGWTGTGLDKAAKEVVIAKGSTGNREYTATWEANKDTKYKVEYYLEDLKGDYKLEETANLEGETDTKATAEIKAFEGFTENTEHKDRKVEGTIKADGSLVLKVYYTRNSYELTLVKGDYIESVAGAGTYKYGEVVEITAVAENKDGYTYSNFAWETAEQGILENAQEKTTKVTMPAKAVEVTAKQEREVKEYTITYDLNNGKVDGTNPEKYTVESEEIKLINPTRDGYTFLGWTGTGLDKATKDVTIAKGSTGNREYTANWEANKDTKYTVEYYTETLDGKYELEETKELKGETDTKATAEIKVFEGFTENENHQDRKVEGTIKADESLVLKVYYTRNSYELTLVKGDHIESVAGAGTYKYGELVEITATAENKEGYTYSNFAWETEDAGILENAQEKTTKVTMPAKAVEVTAKQERTAKEYTITYDLANGKVDGTNPEKYTVESDEIKLINPTRDGYTFLGWTGIGLDKATKEVVIAKGSTGNRAYTATWELAAPTVSITAENLDVNLFENQTTTFTATVQNASNPSYQWYYGENPIQGATESTYAISTTDMNSTNYKGGEYSVAVTNNEAVATLAETGTAQNPTTAVSEKLTQTVKHDEVASAEQMKNFATRVNNQGITFEGDTITQKAEVIDLSSVCGESSNSWTPIGSDAYMFKGTFDGNNNQVTNLYIKQEKGMLGLFGVTKDSTIKNITVNGNITGTGITWRTVAGGVVGRNISGTIDNCVNNVNIVAISRAGGIAGKSEEDSVISNCINNGTITSDVTKTIEEEVEVTTDNGTEKVMQEVVASRWIGGIAGVGQGTISNCTNNGDIVGNKAGGITGMSNNGTTSISNCINNGNLTGNQNGGITYAYKSSTQDHKISNCINTGDLIVKDEYAGTGLYGAGIASSNNGLIEECYNEGNIEVISGNHNDASAVGGIYACDAIDSVVRKCYNTGNIVAECNHNGESTSAMCVAGGIAGYIRRNTSIENCYNRGNISVNKLVGNNTNSAGGIVGYLHIVDADEIEAGEKLPDGEVNTNVNVIDSHIILNCYSTGTIVGTRKDGRNSYVGGVIGQYRATSKNINEIVKNTYYLDTSAETGVDYGTDTTGVAIAKTSDYMKTLHLVKDLGQDNWELPENETINAGYPIFGSEIIYEITYDLDGGKLEEGKTNPTLYVSDNADIVLNNPIKEGYTFLGWTGTGLDNATKDVTIAKGSTGNREYTATWELLAPTVSIMVENPEVNIFDDVTTTFTANVGETYGATYQWYYKGEAIEGATSNTYSIATTDMDTTNYKGGEYSVKVTNNAGEQTAKETQTVARTIGTPEQMKNFNVRVEEQEIDFQGVEVEQVANIDLSSICNETEGSWDPIGLYDLETVDGKDKAIEKPFKGTYEGNNYEVTGLYIDETCDEIRMGLFGYVNTGKINNLTVKGEITTAADTAIAVGGIAGYVYNGEINNCENYADITGYRVGGIVGLNGNLTETNNCINYGKISGNYIGGISYGNVGTISSCVNNGVINANSNVQDESVYGGGITYYNNGLIEETYNNNIVIAIGTSTNNGVVTGGIYSIDNYKSIVKKCYNTAAIYADCGHNGSSTGAMCAAGGIGGYMRTNTYIENCYNTGDITATKLQGANTNSAGGIVGFIQYKEEGEETTLVFNANATQLVKDCYNAGKITGEHTEKYNAVGGVIGQYRATSTDITDIVTNTYYLDTSADTGIDFAADTSSIAIAKTSEYMKTVNFVKDLGEDDWELPENDTINYGYPIFGTETIYEITYDLAGGELPQGKTNPTNYSKNSADIKLNNPTKEGYIFTGWTGTGLDEATEEVVIAKGSTGDIEYTANWEEAVAMTTTQGDVKTYHRTIQSAIDAVEETGTVTLLKNISLNDDADGTATIPAEKTIEFDLNEKTLTVSAVNTIVNKGNLTINGNGTIKGEITGESTTDYVVSNSGGNLTINSGVTITSTKGGLFNNGTVNLEGGIIESTSTENYAISNGGTLIANSGTIKSTYSGIYNNNGDFKLNGATIDVAHMGIRNLGTGTIALNSGEIIAETTSDKEVIGIYNTSSSDEAVVVNGGNIEVEALGNGYAVGIHNTLAGTIDVKQGNITAKSGAGYAIGINNLGTATIKVADGANISGTSSQYFARGLVSYEGQVNVTGGTITGTGAGSRGSYGILSYSTGVNKNVDIQITGGTIIGEVTSGSGAGIGIDLSVDANASGATTASTINIDGPAVVKGISDSGSAMGIYNPCSTGNISVKGAKISGLSNTGREDGINNQADNEVIVTGSYGSPTIINETSTSTSGSGYGIYQSKGTLTLTNGYSIENSIGVEYPSIKGAKYGVYATADCTFNFYDGLIEGSKDSAIYGTVADKPDSAEIYTLTLETRELKYLVNDSVVASYKVEHYIEKEDGTYELKETETLSDMPGKEVETIAKEYEGYTENTEHPDRKATGIVMPNGTLVLKVYYSPSKHNVTYDYETNGGAKDSDNSIKTESSEAVYGSKADLTKAGVKDNYKFVGWNTNKNATEALEEVTIIGDTTLYAIYSKTVSIKYEKNGGQSDITQEYEIYNNETNLEITMPEPTTNLGWEFNGYAAENTAKSGDEVGTTKEITVDKNTTEIMYYHTWSKDILYNTNKPETAEASYEVIFEGTSKKVYYNNAFGELPENPSLAGWTFKGWFTDANDGEEITVDKIVQNISDEIYAQWELVATMEVVPEKVELDLIHNTTETIKVDGTDYGKVSYEVEDNTIADIDEDGNVTAISVGTTKIIVTGSNGNVVCEIEVTVEEGYEGIATTTINGRTTGYPTVQQAIDAAGTNEGAKVTLLQETISEAVTVAANQNIILDLNGNKLTNGKVTTINNLGTLRVIGDGIIEGTGATLIHTVTNDGTLIKDGNNEWKATNTGNNYVVDNNDTGTFIMNDGTLTSNDRGIYNSTNGTIIINGGTINAVDYGIYNDSSETDEENPALKINAGEITSTTEVGVYTVKPGRIEVGNATIVGNTYGIHNESTGTIIIDGANITGEKNWGIYNEASGKITIYGGEIVGNGHGVGCSTASKGEVNVYGGTLKGLTSDGLATGACVVTIGIDDGDVSQTNPHIEGYRYGVNKNATAAKVYFNDGIIIGNTSSAITSTVTGTATGYAVNTVTNETGGKTATLIVNYGEYDSEGNLVNAYSTLATAMEGATSGNTIKVERTLTETVAPTVPADKNVILDMNNQTTTLSGVSLTNNGNLQILGEGNIINTKSNTIKNNGTLSIEEGITVTGVTTYVSGATGAQSTIDNYGNLTLNGGTIIAKSADAIFNESTGKVRINSGTIDANMAILRNFGTASTEEDPSVKISGGTLTAQTANGITNKSSGLLYIEGGTITSKQTEEKPTIYNETGLVKITGGTIISTNERAISNYYEDGYMEITGGTIEGTIGIQNKGTMVITGGIIKSTDGSALINDATLTVGKDDGTINITTPEFVGAAHGINNTSEFYFYDGVIEGAKDSAIHGSVTGKPDSTEIYKLKVGTHEIAYLVNESVVASYNVEHYIEKEDGTYELKETETLYEKPGEEATAVAKNYEGFTENETHPDRKITGMVMPNGSLVLKVYYTRDSYELKLVKEDYIESVIGAGTYEPGAEVEIIAITENLEGYVYSNFRWETEEDGIIENIQEPTTKITMPSKSVEITAKQERTVKEYTITYDLVDGEIEGKNPEKYTIESDEIQLINPTKPGYVFAGWTGSNGDTPELTVTIPKGSTGNKEYIANWEEAHYYNETSDTYYVTLSEATDDAENNSRISVIKDANETVAPTIAEGKNVTLDMNGRTVALKGVSLVNNGTLTITGETGTLTSTIQAIDNTSTGILNKEGNCTITGTGGFSTIYNSGKVTLSEGTIASAIYGGIYNKTTGQIIIDGGKIETPQIAINTWSNLNTDETPAVLINDGEIKSKSANAITNYSSGGLVCIKGGNIHSSQTLDMPTIYNETGIIKVSGGSITSENDRGICNYKEGGEIIITGGKISGETGVQNAEGSILTLGIKDDEVSKTVPEIIGSLYGVWNLGIFNYYDGVIKGQTDSIVLNNTGDIDIPDEYEIVYRTEEIEGIIYDVAELAKIEKYTVNYYNGTTLLDSSEYVIGQSEKLETMSSLGESKSGYTFAGWTKSLNSTEVTYEDGANVTDLTSTPNETVNLYAIWKRNVTFYSGSNLETTETKVQYYNSKGGNYSVTMPTTIKEVDGWNARGWRDDTTAGTSEANGGVKSTSDAEKFYAVYTRDITFKSGLSGETTETVIQYYNTNNTKSEIEMLIPKELSGWITEGWRDDNVAGEESYKLGQKVTPVSKTTYYAIYSRDVGFYSGESNSLLETATQYYNSISAFSTTAPEKTEIEPINGWTALGWRNDTTADASEITPGESTTISDSKFYAVYSRNITFKSGGATGNVISRNSLQYYNSNNSKSAIIMQTPVQVSNWKTVGWRDNITAGDKEYDVGASITPVSVTTYYAVYSRDITLKYNSNGGTGTVEAQKAPQYYNTSGKLSAPIFTLSENAFTKANYTFSKWADGSTTGTQYAAGATYNKFIPAFSDTILTKTMYAIWVDSK